MSLLAEIRQRFAAALAGLVDDPQPWLEMVRRSQDPRHGDYQANFAMPLAGQLKRPPREVAQQVVAALQIDDLCLPPEIAGPGFVNLRIRDDVIAARLEAARGQDRLGIEPAARPQTFVVDYSAPNVAKPMHVGHIRSTVIGDAIYRILRFLGHRVIGDNHIGDWGTQFGMIIFGYKHLLDPQAFSKHRVAELSRLYRLVNQLVEYHEARRSLPEREAAVDDAARQLAAHEQLPAPAASDPKQADKEKKAQLKERRRLETRLSDAQETAASARRKLEAVETEPALRELAAKHPDIGRQVLAETARLHAGDAENVRLWNEILPACLQELDRIYQRLRVTFDVTLGESFYQDRLAGVVDDLLQRGIARETEGAIGVFLPEFDTPMLVRKQDGAFLYATTDLATIRYRMETWRPDAVLYVVDHRQSLHFEQLFAAARLWGIAAADMRHLAFGTVLGKDGRPYKTRSGSTVGLEGLLDEAVAHARSVVQANSEVAEADKDRVAEVVGIGAIKYADLSHNRSSDYVFDYDKMLSTTGNTATYMQYAYARVRSIFRKGEVEPESLRSNGGKISLQHPAERALGLEILRFSEALDDVLVDYRPNFLTNYLFDNLAKSFSTFFENCPVLRAETPELRDSRLLLADLTARTIRTGLDLLGIEVVEQM